MSILCSSLLYFSASFLFLQRCICSSGMLVNFNSSFFQLYLRKAGQMIKTLLSMCCNIAEIHIKLLPLLCTTKPLAKKFNASGTDTSYVSFLPTFFIETHLQASTPLDTTSLSKHSSALHQPSFVKTLCSGVHTSFFSVPVKESSTHSFTPENQTSFTFLERKVPSTKHLMFESTSFTQQPLLPTCLSKNFCIVIFLEQPARKIVTSISPAIQPICSDSRT